ncbi:MAG: arginine deiminase-related protein [Crocinitomicaceae bacterium]|jgi:N-dimethylarginine dimethylaminohydrolase|tara:strand:- start:11735 stop:12655 length:921 start_codon:yes stop_codon:yes gene_type:complete
MPYQKLHVQNETGTLQAVVLGIAFDFGGTPTEEECYDPKSLEHVQNGTFPTELDLVQEMEAVAALFERYKVKVFRPDNILGLNQIFSRDIAFVIDDVFFIPNIIKDRAKEVEALSLVLNQIDPSKIIRFPESARIEGGDVMLCQETIYVGYSEAEDFEKYKVARTNIDGLQFLKEYFPNKEVVGFELAKSDHLPKENALHLDCCFQPVGNNLALICESGFKNKADFEMLVSRFGKENCLFLSAEEMYGMNSNIFSLGPNVVVSQNEFTKVNQFFTDHGLTVEGVAYKEVSKMGGLLRCSTLPLSRL